MARRRTRRIAHGTLYEYNRYGCRCPRCKAAAAEYRRGQPPRPSKPRAERPAWVLHPRGEPFTHVPALHVLALVAEQCPGEALSTRLSVIGLERRVRAILSGEQGWLSLAVADRIVVEVLGRPELWHDDPVLSAIYEAA